MAYEESKLMFESKLYSLMKGCAYEKYEKENKKLVEFKDVKTAKSINLYEISSDSRQVYKELLKTISSIKTEDGRDPNYLIEIYKLLNKRRNFLRKELDDNDVELAEKSLIDADPMIIKLANLYYEMFREWTFIVEKFNHLSEINCKRKELDAEDLKKIAQFMPEQLFRMQYKFTE